MANKKALFIWTLTITLLVSIAFLSSCKTSTDPEPEPPEEPEPIERVGDKELTVNVIHRDNEDELTGYSIEIDGPVTASETNVSTAQFTLSDLESGEYTITVSLNGFVDEEITEEFEVPEEVSSDFFVETTISLRETTPPVTVSNNEDTTVQTGQPDDEDAGEEQATSLEIPANSFPDDVVNEDGTVDISVTRARPSQLRRSADGLVRETITITPVTELNNSVNVKIPVREIEGLEDLEYFLQPGNIPLTRDGNGNLVATLTPIHSSSDGLTANQDNPFDYVVLGTAVVGFPLGGFRLTSPAEMDETSSFTEFTTIEGTCGGPLPEYVLEGVDLPSEVREFLGSDEVRRFSNDRTVTVSNTTPIANRELSIEVSHKQTTYTVTRDGLNVATVTVNRNETRTQNPISGPCHNSGG